MITRVEALNFRCLRYVHRPMNPFHVLVGPNASGKTTFLDVIGLLGDIVSGGLDYALSERTPNPQDLLFGRRGSRLELAVEATVPDALRQPEAQQWNTVRYQVALGYDDTDRQFEFKAETLLLKKATESEPSQRELFPTPPAPPESLLDSIEQRDNKVLVNKASGGNDNFFSESSPATEAGRRRSNSVPSGRRWAICRPTKARFRRRRGFAITLAPAFSGSPSTVPRSESRVRRRGPPDSCPTGPTSPGSPGASDKTTPRATLRGSRICARRCPTWKTSRRWSVPKTAIVIWCTGMLAACPCRPGWSPMARSG